MIIKAMFILGLNMFLILQNYKLLSLLSTKKLFIYCPYFHIIGTILED